MAERNINNSTLRTALINGEPFEYAHLIKFERPFVPFKGKHRVNANRYVYLTDGQRDFTHTETTATVNGNVSSSTSVTLSAENTTIVPGQIVTGTGISGTVKVAAISGTSLTLTSQQTISQPADNFHQTLVFDLGPSDSICLCLQTLALHQH